MSASYSSAAEAEHGADEARIELTRTLDRLKTNLTPGRLAGEAVGAARSRTPDWLVRAWHFASSPAGLGLIGLTAASVVATMVRQRREP